MGPVRADAQRNRERLLAAAGELFTERGLEVTLDDIARRAGVGVGTVYRAFPTKESLFAALAADRFEQIAGFAAEALDVEDPWEAFTGFVRRCAKLQASDRLLSQALIEQPDVMCTAASRSDHQEAVATLVERAKAAGAMRADFEPRDVGMVMCALSSVDRGKGFAWERLLPIVLDGLRAEAGATPLPRP